MFVLIFQTSLHVASFVLNFAKEIYQSGEIFVNRLNGQMIFLNLVFTCDFLLGIGRCRMCQGGHFLVLGLVDETLIFQRIRRHQAILFVQQLN